VIRLLQIKPAPPPPHQRGTPVAACSNHCHHHHQQQQQQQQGEDPLGGLRPAIALQPELVLVEEVAHVRLDAAVWAVGAADRWCGQAV